jgi:hypothetical protein
MLELIVICSTIIVCVSVVSVAVFTYADNRVRERCTKDLIQEAVKSLVKGDEDGSKKSTR